MSKAFEHYQRSIGTISRIAGAITAILGSEVAGSFIGSAGVVGLVSVFILGRREKGNLDRTEPENAE